MKRKIYLGLTMLLGVELMVIIHTLLESWYVSAFIASASRPVRYGFWFISSYLPPWLSALLLIGGLVGGFFLGRWWWQIVYVEKRHWRFRKKVTKSHH